MSMSQKTYYIIATCFFSCIILVGTIGIGIAVHASWAMILITGIVVQTVWLIAMFLAYRLSLYTQTQNDTDVENDNKKPDTQPKPKSSFAIKIFWLIVILTVGIIASWLLFSAIQKKFGIPLWVLYAGEVSVFAFAGFLVFLRIKTLRK
jgi:hypothetical protein